MALSSKRIYTLFNVKDIVVHFKRRAIEMSITDIPKLTNLYWIWRTKKWMISLIHLLSYRLILREINRMSTDSSLLIYHLEWSFRLSEKLKTDDLMDQFLLYLLYMSDMANSDHILTLFSDRLRCRSFQLRTRISVWQSTIVKKDHLVLYHY